MTESKRHLCAICLVISAAVLLAGFICGCRKKEPDVVIYGLGFQVLPANSIGSRMWFEKKIRCEEMPEEDRQAMLTHLRQIPIEEWTQPSPNWDIWYEGFIKNRGLKDVANIRYSFHAPNEEIRTMPTIPASKIMTRLPIETPWDEFCYSQFDGGVFYLRYLKTGETKEVCGTLASGRFRDKSPEELFNHILKGLQPKIEGFSSEQ